VRITHRPLLRPRVVLLSAALAASGLLAASGISACVGQVLDAEIPPAEGGPPEAGNIEPGPRPPADVDAGPAPILDAGPLRDADADAPPPEKKRIFITTTKRDGAFGSLAAGDAYCQAAATGAGLTGSFMAFLSITGANAVDRLNGDGPWYTMDRQTLIFSGKRTGSQPISGVGPAVALTQNEIGQDLGANVYYWTGTDPGGVASTSNCVGWTNNAVSPFASGTVGTAGTSNGQWTAWNPMTCYSQAHLLCFEN